jgi:hypothetical protein
MKSLIIGLLLLLPLQIIHGQDKIITVERDTILCRIISVSPTHIQYEQKGNDGYMVGKFIPNEQVLEYLRSPQSSEVNPYGYPSGRQKQKTEHPWMIGIYAGVASLTASTANAEQEMIDMGVSKSKAKDYCSDLKNGWSFNGDIHYLSDNIGFGVQYSLFFSSVRLDLTMRMDASQSAGIPEYISLDVDERVYIHYVGPSLILRQRLDDKQKFQLMETFSAGYVYYRDEIRMGEASVFGSSMNGLIEGKTWGATTGVYAEYFPTRWLSVGANAGIMYARLTKADVSTAQGTQNVKLDKKDYVSLARLDFSLGVHFHF